MPIADRSYVVVSGPPGSGKSTLAPVVAGELALPLLAKDTIKEALLAQIPVSDVDGSRRIGRAAMEALFALAAESPVGAVLEANFHRTVAPRPNASRPDRRGLLPLRPRRGAPAVPGAGERP